MSDTLRTDDAEKEFATKWAVKGAVSSSFARELERELLSCSDDCAFMDRARERIAALEAERDAHQKMGAAAILRNVEMGKILMECYDWMANNGGPGRLLRQADAALAREVPAP
jgi:hypothetical protein